MAHDGKRWRVFDPSPMPDGADDMILSLSLWI